MTKLTPRQHEVLKALQAGHKTSEIAGRTGVNQTTVREHIKHIKRFYVVESSGDHAYQEAVKRARKLGDLWCSFVSRPLALRFSRRRVLLEKLKVLYGSYRPSRPR